MPNPRIHWGLFLPAWVTFIWALIWQGVLVFLGMVGAVVLYGVR